MKYQLIAFLVEIFVLIVGVIFLKIFSGNKKINSAAFTLIADWAYKLVINARNVLSNESGETKKLAVSEELKQFAENQGIFLDEVQISALIEEAYERMLASQAKEGKTTCQ